MDSVIYKVRWVLFVLGMNKATGRSFRKVTIGRTTNHRGDFDMQSKELVLLAFCINSKYIQLYGE